MALPGRFDKLSIRFRGVLRPGGPASGPAGTMTCSWTFGPSLPVRPARLSSAHALHPPDPGPCAGIGEDQRKTSLPGPRACHAEGKTPRASAGPGHGPQERRLSTARASEHPAGLPLAGRLEKPELLGAHRTRDSTRVCGCPEAWRKCPRPLALTPPVLASSVQANTLPQSDWRKKATGLTCVHTSVTARSGG